MRRSARRRFAVLLVAFAVVETGALVLQPIAAYADPPPGYCIYIHPIPPAVNEIALCTP